MNFLEKMDLSLWDPPENQVYTDESSYPSWEYNLYFDPRLDVIEADALNKKSCLQVLEIQANKADSEIGELEDDKLMIQRQLACEDNMGFAALNNLESMLKPLKNENQQLAGTTLAERHAAQQATKEYSSKSTVNGVKAVQINDPSGMKGQEVVHAGTVRTIEGTRLRLLNSIRGDRSNPQRKLMGGGEYYGDNTIRGTQQHLAGAKRAGGFAGISATSQFHFRRRSETSFCVPVVQENNNQRNAQNMLVRSHDRTSQAPRNVHNVEVVFPMRITPASCMACIDNMSLVQLKALANQLNIVGVSKTRKADLQQLLRSKLQAQDWS
ncbi:uncharacterized protein [Solanum tuberosum]|nr:PREDICTED: uncharacterized protein LOC102586833 [Solanum tuberosum]